MEGNTRTNFVPLDAGIAANATMIANITAINGPVDINVIVRRHE